MMRIGNSICIHNKLEVFCFWHRIRGILWINPPPNLFFTDLFLYFLDCFSAVSCLCLVHDFLQFKDSITSKPRRRSGGQISTTHKRPLLLFQKKKLKKKKKKKKPQKPTKIPKKKKLLSRIDKIKIISTVISDHIFLTQ